MKKLLTFAIIAMLSTSSIAAIKCVPDGRGGTCCWDTDREGPWKPLGC